MNTANGFKQDITQRDQVLDWYERGFSAEDIAKEVGLSIDHVREMLREYDSDYDG